MSEKGRIGRIAITLNYEDFKQFEEAARIEKRTTAQLLKVVALEFLEMKAQQEH